MHFDAGTRKGNPGESAVGVYAYLPDDSFGFELKLTRAVGVMTNNEAEWIALITALELAVDHGTRLQRLRIVSDSKLVVNQALGRWRTRDHLVPYKRRAYELCDELVQRDCQVTIEHVKRSKNAEADRIVTSFLDARIGKKRGY